ncbi:bifunctional diguanylate cyclase/phosphodiesterase [Luteimonas sp. 22616]|uniref:bifunctional diguanylate cyclase/phosphodiesterase n=1 Tax=Luteimonas sp. 22616 TaxID=3453951 RepID=UPI003F866E63
MERSGHSAATATPLQGEEAAARSLLLGMPAWLFALAGLLAGLLVTGAVVLLERGNLQAEAQLQDSQFARRSVAQVARQLETSGLLLRALQSSFMVDDKIDRQQFAGVHDNLRAKEVLPSLIAMVFARRQDPESPGARPRYMYENVVPLDGNRSLVGFDMAAQPANLHALLRARDTDQPVMSAAFPLRQPVSDPRDALGVVVRLPVYSTGSRPLDVAQRRERELGALGISMRVRPMLLAALPPEALRRYRVRVLDTTDGTGEVLFDSEAGPVSDARSHGGDVAFGERHWQVLLQPLGSGYDASLLWLMAVTGAIASMLLALLLWSAATMRRRAVTLGRQLAERYRESEERFRTLNDLLPALVLMARADDGCVVYANEAASTRLGGNVASGETPLASLFEDPALQRALSTAMEDVHWSNVDTTLRTLGGDRFWASTSISQVQLGGLDKLLMVASDTSEQRQLTELLSYQATHDALTGLCNRREFERSVRRTLQAVARGGASAALLYIDLDQFKLINDTSGHLAGDQLLSQLALAMSEHLRGEDLLARLGGDEFGVLARDMSVDGAQLLAERLRTRIEGLIFVWEQRSYTISASIGMVMIDRAGMTLEDVFAHADAACYMAKDHGRNRIHVYSAQEDETVQRRGEMEWANRLRWVVEEGRLLLDYQEVLPLQGQPETDPHIELLIRLRDEEGRIVPPGAFLPAAERYGMMPSLDRWVIGEAIANFDRLHASGRAPGRCALNLAASTLEDEGLADYVLDLIARHGVAPSRLCFEITETEAVRNLARAVRVMERLRAVGCQVALDDFGAGMSSFGYLKNLPVDVIKIDGSFIRELDSDPMSRSIVDVITEIGHQRGLDVVAEWVASANTVELLRELGVDYGQGFALHRPERVLYQR